MNSMKGRLIAILALSVLVLLPGQAWAPVFGFFPGLTKLIDRADFIVVAKIVEQAPDSAYDLGGGAVHKIRILAVMKGDIKPEGEAKAYLRNLPFRQPEVSKYTALSKRFSQGERYVLFLVKSTNPEKYTYQGENCSGDSFWVSPSSNLSELRTKDVRGSIKLLLDDVVAFQRAELRDLEEVAAGYLNSK